MENISTLNRTEIGSESNVMNYIGRSRTRKEESGKNPVINDLISEGGENFFDYLNWNGLAHENNMLVLSSRHHYYYDPTELKSVTTLINIKKQ